MQAAAPQRPCDRSLTSALDEGKAQTLGGAWSQRHVGCRRELDQARGLQKPHTAPWLWPQTPQKIRSADGAEPDPTTRQSLAPLAGQAPPSFEGPLARSCLIRVGRRAEESAVAVARDTSSPRSSRNLTGGGPGASASCGANATQARDRPPPCAMPSRRYGTRPTGRRGATRHRQPTGRDHGFAPAQIPPAWSLPRGSATHPADARSTGSRPRRVEFPHAHRRGTS